MGEENDTDHSHAQRSPNNDDNIVFSTGHDRDALKNIFPRQNGFPSSGANRNRVVRLLEPLQDRPGLCNNVITTSHYTVANFVPKNLSEQFTKIPNIYFLLLSLLQTLPKITTTGHVPTILLPLVCILFLNALKDAVEDWRRHISDRIENERTTLCTHDKHTACHSTSWCEVQAGDVVVVKNHEYVPADLIVLASAHEEGHAWVETANLDGETNLKSKQAPDAIFKMVGRHDGYENVISSMQNMDAHIECEGPNEFLYSFVGTLHVGGMKIALDDRNLLLRGCKVASVSWVVGVPVYTGKQSKIMMNSKERKYRKLSHLERDLGKFTGAIFSLQLILCVTAACSGAAFETNKVENEKRTYLIISPKADIFAGGLLIFVIRFFNFIILFSNFIPISLLVSVSLVKLAQAFLMNRDADMIHEGVHCIPRTSDLNEEMGQVDYIFSDKTGTLTRNVMDFRKFSVNGTTYGSGMTEVRRSVLMKTGQPVEDPPIEKQPLRSTPHVDLVDEELDKLLHARSGPQFAAVRTLLLHLAINHEVMPEKSEDDSLVYSASSPDEAALCYGARHFGFTFCARDSKGITLKVDGGESTLRISILATLRFTSARRRSSVIARFHETHTDGSEESRTVIFTKGADSAIIARLAPRLHSPSDTMQSMRVLKAFAEDGLRTLCFAGRSLPQEEVDNWLERYAEASTATEDRQHRVDQVSDEIERNLEFQGITGIEDRLQDEVGTTIAKLLEAGIRVWMLTGDKMETAINIGIATGLLDPQEGDRGERPVFTSSDFEVEGVFLIRDMARKLRIVVDKAQEAKNQGRMFECFIIDGKCLEVALEPDNALNFVAACRVCRTVICCRVSPKQKGAIVRLMKEAEKAITLAIGDGANDCNMITSADVGVGIRGVEGLQAFNVCDYGISQFRFLQQLLLVHGRWCYRRVAILMCYTFYKNIVVVLPQYFLGIMSGFSGQKLYNDILYQSYNVAISMAPIMLFGILDQDVSKKVSLRHPELYKAGTEREYLNVKVAMVWMFSGLWHAAVVFFVPFYAMSNGNTTHPDGKSNDIWLLGSVVYLLVTIVVNLRAVLETCYLSWMTAASVAFSLVFWTLIHGCLSGLFTGSVVSIELHGSFERMFGSPMIWIIVLVSTALALLADMQRKGIQCCLFPTTLQQVQEKVWLEKSTRKVSPPDDESKSQ